MVYIQTKNPDLGKFWRVLQWKMLVYFMFIWCSIRSFSIFCGHFGIFYGHLVYFSPFWYVGPRKIWQPCYTTRPFMKCRCTSCLTLRRIPLFFAFFFIREFISRGVTPSSLLFHTGQYFLKQKTLLQMSASHINLSSSVGWNYG
jgi:hypothetical protein